MDVKLEVVRAEVLRRMRELGYSDESVRQTLIAFRELNDLAEKRGTDMYTKELGAALAARTTSPSTGKHSEWREEFFGRIARVCDSLIDTGEVDLSVRRSARGPALESEELRSAYERWEDELSDSELAAETKRGYLRMAGLFLEFVESVGVTSLPEAGGDTVTGFLANLRGGRWAGTQTCYLVLSLRPFIKHLGRRDLLDALLLADMSRERKIIPVIADEDQEAMVSACLDPNLVCRRDAAITLLALTSGMRSCDIAGMKLGDVDWGTGTISIVQSKTGNPLSIPLLPAVGNAICDYILEERPESSDDRLFLRRIAPHVGIACHSTIYQVIRGVQAVAGVVGAPCGTRALRHNAASRMLRAGIQLPTISAVLGHADPKSSDIYITADVERMRECVLPFPRGGANG